MTLAYVRYKVIVLQRATGSTSDYKEAKVGRHVLYSMLQLFTSRIWVGSFQGQELMFFKASKEKSITVLHLSWRLPVYRRGLSQ
ncbi:hypothetical protein GDO81_012567 [Engystomops pustulosus]|uniref:Uncharacterized protein n=1 Tax=Engystomops pustulosus TaxID=76066 RepID=A0AAV7BMC4_ENGPU|nr:hypothetical protein GDO81_012567 [Engystomops pustulosus]